MDFELTEEQKMFKDMARKFADQEILPTLKESERQEIFDPEIIKTYMENKSQVFDANAVQYRINKNREGYIGWLGYTGSVLQWHLDQKISFAYVPAESNFIDFYA